MEAEGQNEDDSILNIVDVEEFIIQMKLHENHILLDVRLWLEYKRGRLPCAILAENSKVLLSIADTLDRDKPLFLYCADNFRSKAAGRSLAEHGFNNIYILDVGFNGWKASGKEIDKTRPKISKHQIKKSII